MSVKRALFRYLTDARALEGHAAERFASARTVQGVTLWSRNEARQMLRDRVGDRIYADRRQQQADGHTSIEIATVGEDPDYDFTGETGDGSESLMLRVSARGGDAPSRVETAASLVRLAVSGFRGYWDGIYVGECTATLGGTYATSPPDASDKWTHTQTVEVMVSYRSFEAPVYPAQQLAALATALADASTLSLSGASSIVPEGRPIQIAAWEVRSGNESGTIRASFSGAPHVSPSVANVTGTRLSPTLARSALSLTGPWWAKLTITDETGTTSSHTITGV